MSGTPVRTWKTVDGILKACRDRRLNCYINKTDHTYDIEILSIFSDENGSVVDNEDDAETTDVFGTSVEMETIENGIG